MGGRARSRNSMARVKEQWEGRGERVVERVERRAKTARNCSSRSTTGTEVGVAGAGGGGGGCWDVGSGGGGGGRCEVGCRGEGVSKVVRASEGGTMGKAEVEKMKRSRGRRAGE